MGRLTCRVERFDLPFRKPLVTGRGTISTRSTVVVTVSDGRWTGRGEAAPIPGERPDADVIEAALRDWLPPADVVDLAQVEALALPGPAPARHGAEQALLALIGARGGRSLARVLGRPRAQVPVNALVRDADDAREAVARGFRTLKVKVGAASLDEDDRRLARIRAAAGPGIALRADANGAWSERRAAEALVRLARHDLELVEEPCHGLEALARLRGGPVPIAADESLGTPDDLERLLRLEAADVVVIKPMRVGSLIGAVSMVGRAREAGLGAFVTTSLEGGIGRDGALAVAAVAPVSAACGLDTGHLLARDVAPGPEIAGGFARVPLTAGRIP